ncbi:hypothetical protein COV42_00610 [Candidatus Campbellbacteria bacterium CG11_big_fil_rev_8_21_14_0_20_44_21]|uniref:RNase H type-1 domain-containing protein n=1 Tax=Candidatus Campbellbacteria bacterium CG22_combo_CG10-13_8_21_14_all_43_18 TaxID=1974530 RepID=A0A2H0DWD8_9BACT|nr:MAG: hypothetical protein COW82_01805 [Candidatus Campbellbacteria bacterium CG22_combo_CG10-13_8_21_14_all_43_18]PIR24469.1 MAG: hypothetical protein COV42_00610 [Candidatus Campbellbacteria bacterium CG11_big_fil_rev_8_21_14_0_20_44_21]
MQSVIIYTDGGSRGNPGPAGAGWVIRDEKGRILKKNSAYLGRQTNNWAEYEAVIQALGDLKRLVPKDARKGIAVEVVIDSELVVRQLSGKYQIKEEALQLQYMKVHNARVADFPNTTFRHVPREHNADADKLANMAMDEAE